MKVPLKFMVAVSETAVRDQLAKFLTDHFSDSRVYLARDGAEVLQKLEFDHPHILILDTNLTVKTCEQIVSAIYEKPLQQEIQIIVIGELEKKGSLDDHVVSGKLQLLPPQSQIDVLTPALYKAISRLNPSNKEFSLKYLAKGQVLLNEGEPGDCLYIVKKGTLTAFTGLSSSPHVLGKIGPGEFVGEMAYINGEPRSATVMANDDCELVEFKIEAFERMIYQKPSWMKVLLQTLSRRIKRLNVFKQR